MSRKKSEQEVESEEHLVCGVPVALYRKWLNDPVTKAVYAALEKTARPQPMPNNSAPEEYQYRLGFVTGYWSALDMPRNLAPVESNSEVTQDYL